MIETLIDDLSFLIGLIAAEGLICRRFGRRAKYALRFFLSILPSIFLSLLWNNLTENLHPSDMRWLHATRYLSIFLLTIPWMAACYKGDLWAYLFAGSVAYCMQHIAYQLHELVFTLVNGQMAYWAKFLLLVATSVLLYGIVWYVYLRHLQKNKVVKVNSHLQVAVSAIVLIITVYVSLFSVIAALASGNTGDLRAILLFCILFCIVAIMLEMSFVRLKENEIEMAILQHMISTSKSQYQETKENVEVINIKCHDLRHQIRSLSGRVDQEELNRIAEALRIYDANLRTGNDALDIIIMEKGLLCSEKGIRLTCMLDTSIIEHMRYSGIYSFFGNAIENAMDAVSELGEDKRCISISGKRKGGCSNIVIENYFDGKIEFENGLPQTKKEGPYHGFGVKSINIITEQYGGDLEFTTEGDIFRLEAFFPQEQPEIKE